MSISEIRDSDIHALFERVRKRAYKKYLTNVRLVGVRGYKDASIRFDFPVTAVVGPNGSGKTTVLGAAALIYKSVQPRRFFAKSGKYDDSMKDWSIEYELVDKSHATSPTSVSRTASYRKAKWNRDAMEREVAIIGITRTVPASERKNLYRFVGGEFSGFNERKLSVNVVEAVRRILDKDADDYLQVDADNNGKESILAVRDPENSDLSYSEFHFGAGEASIVRIVSAVEDAQEDSLILIEELENGLHPVATRRLVEYLVTVAHRKGCQVIFTTHSNDALAVLPSDAVWSTYRGKLTQGKLDVAALRTLTGQVDAALAIFTEDDFASLVAETSLRSYSQRYSIDLSSIDIHYLGGAAPARDHTRFHNDNPAKRFPAIALLDGDKRSEAGYDARREDVTTTRGDVVTFKDLLYIPGEHSPEEAILDDILNNLNSGKSILGKLTLSLQLDISLQDRVQGSVETRCRTNHDRHVIFRQIGEDLDFLPQVVVQRAFASTWALAFPEKIDDMWHEAHDVLPGAVVGARSEEDQESVA